MIKILYISCSHTGAENGLATPGKIGRDFAKPAGQLFDFYRATIKAVGPVDLLVHLGDAVDGPGTRESIGLWTTDTKKQADAACEVLELVRARERRFCYGTPYHTVGSYSFEEAIAQYFKAEILDTHYLKINGVRINARHVVGRSDIPYGQGTPLLREVTRDGIEALLTEDKAADWVIRGHVHYSLMVRLRNRWGVTVSSLQLPGSVYGRRMMAPYYDCGMGLQTIDSKGLSDYEPLLMDIKLVRKRHYETIK